MTSQGGAAGSYLGVVPMDGEESLSPCPLGRPWRWGRAGTSAACCLLMIMPSWIHEPAYPMVVVADQPEGDLVGNGLGR